MAIVKTAISVTELLDMYSLNNVFAVPEAFFDDFYSFCSIQPARQAFGHAGPVFRE
jgi:hypothetical protein